MVEIGGVHEKARAFETAAGVYENSRPGYPVGAVNWLTGVLAIGPGRRVVDLAAGTGKFTRALVGSGAQVIAMEPVAGMRKSLAAGVRGRAGGPAVSVVAAVAQALPVGDGAVDAITVAQGFHWFATGDVLAEMHRALRPGGGLGLIWNHRDTGDPLQAALTELMEPVREGTPSYDTGEWRAVLEPGELFGGREEFHVPWEQAVDVEGVAERVASVSFIAALAERDRERLLDEVRGVAAGVDGPLSLKYVADVFAYRRTGK